MEKGKIMPRGAKASPPEKIAAAPSHKKVGATPPIFLYPLNNFKNLAFWGNDVYGDCVTAEEAFAKTCNEPPIVVPNQLAIDWATTNGYLNGAVISEVVEKMTQTGFLINGDIYGDGGAKFVNWRDNAILQNAISSGPVKLGINADQLNYVYNEYDRTNGWFATEFKQNLNIDHCVSLCGYGTISWLAGQLGVAVPTGIDGTQIGYAMFTWDTIGIINVSSLQAITGEAWVRNPSTVIRNTSPVKICFEALGGETGLVLSHANGTVGLQKGYRGTGELFFFEPLPGGAVAIVCGGGEAGQYLSHAYGNVCLQPSYQGTGEAWVLRNRGGFVSIECLGGENGYILSHANGKLWLQGGYAGTGEAWAQINV